MSQLTIGAIASSAITSLSRTSNVVTCVLTTGALPGFAVGNFATVTGTTAASANQFNGTFEIVTVNGGITQLTWNQVAPNDTAGAGGTCFAQPGFTDISDGLLYTNQPFTQTDALAISHNAKFGTVRSETLTMGFYTSNNIVPNPVSPVDGYVYSFAECIFNLQLASCNPPAGGFVPGQLTFPVLSPTLGAGQVLSMPYVLDIDRATGFLTCTFYYATSGQVAQGVVLVTAICQRLSVNA